jgi:hypothetical protein
MRSASSLRAFVLLFVGSLVVSTVVVATVPTVSPAVSFERQQGDMALELTLARVPPRSSDWRTRSH